MVSSATPTTIRIDVPPSAWATACEKPPYLMKMVGASRVFDCVREVYGLDPHIEAAALAILDASGFNDDVERVDPTKTS